MIHRLNPSFANRASLAFLAKTNCLVLFPAAALLVCLIVTESLGNDLPYEVAWIRHVGSERYDWQSVIAIDGAENVYIGGNTADELRRNGFVAKLSSSGELQWNRFTAHSLPFNSLSAIAVDNGGTVYTAGGDQQTHQDNGDIIPYLDRYDPDGNELWWKQLDNRPDGGDESFSHGSATSLIIGPSGDLIVAGGSLWYTGTQSTGFYDGFLTKIAADGSVQWSRAIGTENWDDIHAMAVDGQGNIVVTGATEGNMAGQNQGPNDAFVSKLGPNGSVLWTKQFGTASDDRGTSVAIDLHGDIYVVGVTREESSLIKYDSGGQLVWSRELSPSSTAYFESIDTDENGRIYLCGVNNDNAFLVNYDSSGNLLWTYEFGTLDFDGCSSVQVSPNGNVFLSGMTEGELGGIAYGGGDIFVVKLTPVPEPTSIISGAFAVLFVVTREFRKGLRRAAWWRRLGQCGGANSRSDRE